MGLLWLGIVWSLALFGFVAEKTFEPVPNHDPARPAAQASSGVADDTYRAPHGFQAELLQK